MQTFQFEAMDATGQEIRDEINADNEEQAQATIREMEQNIVLQSGDVVVVP